MHCRQYEENREVMYFPPVNWQFRQTINQREKVDALSCIEENSMEPVTKMYHKCTQQMFEHIHLFVFCSFILFGGQIFVTLFLSAISERERERNTLFFVVNFQVYCVNFPHAQHFTSRHRSCEENRIENIPSTDDVSNPRARFHFLY